MLLLSHFFFFWLVESVTKVHHFRPLRTLVSFFLVPFFLPFIIIINIFRSLICDTFVSNLRGSFLYRKEPKFCLFFAKIQRAKKEEKTVSSKCFAPSSSPSLVIHRFRKHTFTHKIFNNNLKLIFLAPVCLLNLQSKQNNVDML